MAKIFYDHLTNVGEIVIEFDNCELTIEEKQEFISLVDETINNRILDVILTSLPRDFHENFLSLFHKQPYDTMLLSYLKEFSPEDVEEKIKTESEAVKKEVLAEIKKSQKKAFS